MPAFTTRDNSNSNRGAKGVHRVGDLFADAAGELSGTTAPGGANGDGTVSKISSIDGSDAGTPASFDGASGAYPDAGLIAGAAGNLAGTTIGPFTNTDTDTITIDIQAFTDGRDLLVIQGDTLQWDHLDYAAVGRHNGDGNGNEPTIITTTLNGVIQLNQVDWYPTWPEPPPAEIRYPASSSVFSGLTPALPASDIAVSLDAISARDSLTIYQLPSAANGETLILDFNDDLSGGAAWYDALVTITYQISPAPVLSGGGKVSYMPQGTAVAVDAGLGVSDAESGTLVGARVAISAGFSSATR